MAYLTSPAEVQLGPQERLVIPAQIRRLLGFEPGDRLVVRLEDGRLILEKQVAIRRRLKDRSPGCGRGRALRPRCWPRRETEREEGRLRRFSTPRRCSPVFKMSEGARPSSPLWLTPRFEAAFRSVGGPARAATVSFVCHRRRATRPVATSTRPPATPHLRSRAWSSLSNGSAAGASWRLGNISQTTRELTARLNIQGIRRRPHALNGGSRCRAKTVAEAPFHGLRRGRLFERE